MLACVALTVVATAHAFDTSGSGSGSFEADILKSGSNDARYWYSDHCVNNGKYDGTGYSNDVCKYKAWTTADTEMNFDCNGEVYVPAIEKNACLHQSMDRCWDIGAELQEPGGCKLLKNAPSSLNFGFTLYERGSAPFLDTTVILEGSYADTDFKSVANENRLEICKLACDDRYPSGVTQVTVNEYQNEMPYCSCKMSQTVAGNVLHSEAFLVPCKVCASSSHAADTDVPASAQHGLGASIGGSIGGAITAIVFITVLSH